jgi:2-polyprenyl-3-methyl-5-hydroxy-6-metoxy-1,4-benzoquinol methylase
MTGLRDQERATYEQVWTTVDTYGAMSPGVVYLPIFLDLVGAPPPRMGATVLDAGCGSGKGALALRDAGFHVGLCDVTAAGLVEEAHSLPFVEACLWHDLRHVPPRIKHQWGRSTVDYVYCCDVLEHLPPQFTMLAVDQLLRIAKHGVFLSVALQPDQMGIWIGQPLHQTVEAFRWWRDSLREVGDVVDARDLHQSGTYFVRPRR